MDSDDEEEDEDDPLFDENGLYVDGGDDSESDVEIDNLDDLDEPRIQELEDGDEVPQLVKSRKGKGKRAVDELSSDEVDAHLNKLLGVNEKEDKKGKPQARSSKLTKDKPSQEVRLPS